MLIKKSFLYIFWVYLKLFLFTLNACFFLSYNVKKYRIVVVIIEPELTALEPCTDFWYENAATLTVQLYYFDTYAKNVNNFALWSVTIKPILCSLKFILPKLFKSTQLGIKENISLITAINNTINLCSTNWAESITWFVSGQKVTATPSNQVPPYPLSFHSWMTIAILLHSHELFERPHQNFFASFSD